MIPGTADDAIYLQAPHYNSTVYRDVAPGTRASYDIELVAQTEGYGVIACDLYSRGRRFESWSGHRLPGQVTGVSLVPAAKSGIVHQVRGGTQIFKKSMTNLKILNARRVTRSNVFGEVA